MPYTPETLAGGLLGLLVGDALGVPYEFKTPAEIARSGAVDLPPPASLSPTHGVPPGTWSDDGAQALALLDSLLSSGRLDPDDLAARLRAWYEQGRYTPDGRVFDVGIQTRQALANLAAGVNALDAGPASERANGNGSLMRVLPLALWHRGDDAALVADACAQSRVTHGHPRSQACCALYCLWARRIIEQAPDPWPAAVAALRAIVPPGDPRRQELDTHVRPDDPPAGSGSGYVVDCLNSARMAVAAGDSYAGIVQHAVALGDDTDTTACVAGGIAGLRFGQSGIPQPWRDALLGHSVYRPLLDRLVAHHAPTPA
jgi:ADP-ribosylglycohydrolase